MTNKNKKIVILEEKNALLTKENNSLLSNQNKSPFSTAQFSNCPTNTDTTMSKVIGNSPSKKNTTSYRYVTLKAATNVNRPVN